MLQNNEMHNDDSYDKSYEIIGWDDLDMDHDILRGIFAYGFEKPSPIQQKAVKAIMSGKDIIAQAQSGTGKTGAFAIGALTRVNLSDNSTQVLVLSPTKELALQTSNVIEKLGGMMKGLRVQTLCGGMAIDDSFGSFKKDVMVPHIISGCSGRIFDMMRRDKITSKNIKLIILDEADEMLSTGFKEQVYNIFQYLSNDIQVALFSATLPENIYTITNQMMRNPVKISVKAEQLTLEGISQYFIAIEDDRQKYLSLKDIFSFISLSQCIIYCNSVKRVIDLYEAMSEDNFPVCCIHSSMERNDRELAFSDFRTGKCRVLISSNVTARGIDVQQVSTVINFDIPKDPHTYLHRIGRSGRWGRKGVGINFMTRRDIGKIKDIESYYECEINEMPSSLDFFQK